MFANTGIQVAPGLPATVLAPNCYSQMFARCNSLNTMPALNSIFLASNCYYQMFRECVTLTHATDLPAEILVDNCYKEMFKHCINLNSVKAMFLNYENLNNFIDGWLDEVASQGTFTKNANAQWQDSDVVPDGWTVQTA